MNGEVYDNTAAQMHFPPTIAQNQLTQYPSIPRKSRQKNKNKTTKTKTTVREKKCR